MTAITGITATGATDEAEATVSPMSDDQPTDGFMDAVRTVAGDVVQWGWERVVQLGAIGPRHRKARRFGHFGNRSAICFPVAALFGEEYIRIGSGVVVGPYSSLSAGIAPGHVPDHDPVISIGDRTVIGKGSGIVGHASITIGDDVWTGHHVYITDANHGYEDVTEPIGRQFGPSRPVVIESDSWLGHGAIVLPGAHIGRHVVIGAGAVVTGPIPDCSVAVGNPARVVRRFEAGEWVRVRAEAEAALLV
ncbi:MAG: putative sugar acetyltransferase [Actinomycetia bacterium]|nr:putative sugar acetyltransferase [Actinomycetes bacterium]